MQDICFEKINDSRDLFKASLETHTTEHVPINSLRPMRLFKRVISIFFNESVFKHQPKESENSSHTETKH